MKYLVVVSTIAAAAAACGTLNADNPTPPSPSPQADSDASVIVSDGGVVVRTFCETNPGLACADFDGPSFPPANWIAVPSTGGGVVGLVPSAFSPPNAVRTFLPSTPTASIRAAFFALTNRVMPPSTKFHVEARVRIEARTEPMSNVELVAFGDMAGESKIVLVLTGGGLAEFREQTGSRVGTNDFPFSENEWHRVVINIQPNTTKWQLTCLVDNVEVATGATSATASSVGINVGPYVTTASGALDFRYDNVLIVEDPQL